MNNSVLLQDKKRINLFVPLISTAIFYLALYVCSHKIMPVIKLHSSLLLDFTLQVIIGYILFSFSRKTYLFLTEQFILMGIIYIGHALKLSFFGAPLVFDDLFSFLELCFVLKTIQVFFLVSPLILFLVLFLINFKIYRKASSISFIGILLAISIIIFGPQQKLIDSIESHFDYMQSSQAHNFVRSGGSVYSLYQSLRFLKDRPEAPDANSVAHALKELNINRMPAATNSVYPDKFNPRNIYVILMESLWDPLEFKKITFSADPWDYEFRRLWDQAGNSLAMGPAFGGGTANPEFELLTGHPANLYGSKIMFESGILNNVPALPALLSQYGYRTYAFHPNIAGFWNRLNIYLGFGFTFYFSLSDFMLDDLNGPFLSNESLYRQAMQLADKRDKKNPKLFYILTFTGHPPYELNEAKRPTYIKSNSSILDVTRYANVMRYATKETADFIKLILKNDPDALIVITGDHLPMLGPRFAAFVESGILEDSQYKFTAEMCRIYASTPLIIIDGKNGPIKVGSVTMHEVPGIILSLLKFPRFSTIDIFKPPDKLHIRVFPGMSLVLNDETGIMQLCKAGSESKTCRDVSDWLENIKIIDRDILFGKQFSVQKAIKEQ